MPELMQFNDEQNAALVAARESFNVNEEAKGVVSPLVGNASPIGIDAWRRIDGRATLVQRDVLNVFNRLASANTIPVGVGDIVSYYAQVSDSGEANVTMDGRNQGKNDQANVKFIGTPVPVIDDYVRFGWRQMAVMGKGGVNLEVASIQNAQRKVAEKMEDMVLNGQSATVVGGNTIYGLRNFPQRNTNTHGFDLSATTGANWLAAFVKLVNALVGDNAFGRVTVFLNYGDYVYADMNEFTSGYPKTILQRLREISQIADIVPCSKVPADEILGVAGLETGEWGGILSASPMVTVPLNRANAQDDYVFKVMAMVAPQFRSDFDGKAPVAHITAS